MKKQLFQLGAAAALGVFAAGCGLFSGDDKEAWNPAPVVASHTAKAVKIDGVLDDAVWQEAAKFQLSRSADWVGGPPLFKEAVGGEMREPGYVMVAWDDQYLYVAFSCVDADIEVHDKANQKHLYLTGDLGEVFIKPANAPYYWENYVSPLGNKTSLFFPSRAFLGLKEVVDTQPMKGLKTAAKFVGTLNDWQDTDEGWTGEMAIPIAELEQYGMKFDAETPWTIFFGRYNYGAGLPQTELSCYPVLPSLSFHFTEYYAPLQLKK